MFKSINKFEKYLTDLTKDSLNFKEYAHLLKLAETLNKGVGNQFTEGDIQKVVKRILVDGKPYCNGKGHIVPYQLAKYMTDKTKFFTHAHNIYYYDRIGVYKPIDERALFQEVYNKTPFDSDKTPPKAKEVVEDIKTITYVGNEMIHDNKRYINVKNGVIDTSTRKLKRHSSKFKTTLQFQGNYMKSHDDYLVAFENSNFKKFLETTLSECSIVTLQELFGLILSPHAVETQKAFLFLGDGSNGKSTVANIIVALLGGKEHMSCLGLHDFEKRFDLSSIEGMHLNMNIDDESVALQETGKFKSVVAGDTVSVERKGKDKITYTPNLTCILGLNRMPSTADRSHGFYRRCCIIPFNHTFGTAKEVEKGTAKYLKNPMLEKSIINNELDIVLMWALDGLYRLMDNEFVLSENEETAAALNDFKMDTDTVYAFFTDKIQLTELNDSKITGSILYNHYVNYCDFVAMCAPQSNVNFAKGMKSLGCKCTRTNKGVVYTNVVHMD